MASYSKDSIIQVAAGQKGIMFAILLYIICIIASAVCRAGDVDGLNALFTVIGLIISPLLAWFFIFKLSTGLGSGVVMAVIYCVLVSIPIIGLLVLISLNTRATKRLRGAGIHVGLMGANSRDLDSYKYRAY